MRVGFGCTVYARGFNNQHLDGIGYYTKELINQIATTNEIRPVVFGYGNIKKLFNENVINFPKFSYCATASALTNLDFIGANKVYDRIDLFHAPDHHVPHFRGVPVLATLMDAIPLSNPEFASSTLRGFKNKLWKKTTEWADHIITISDFSKREISTHFNIPASKISVVPLGVDERYFYTLPIQMVELELSKLKLPKNYFLFIGTLQPRKNLLRVINAHKMLAYSVRKEFPLVIVGRIGWGCDGLLDLLKSLPNKEPIYWLRDIDDFSKRLLLQQATALVFPSLSEGFGLPVLEAFAAATPVITSNTSSLPEVSGDAALLVDPLQESEIAHAMSRVINDAPFVQSLIAKGLNRARIFTWGACAEKTRAIYREMT